MLCALSTFTRARGPSQILAVLVVAWASLILAAPVRAADPSAYVTEILTPAGWELLGVWCGELDEPFSSVELRTPEGWANSSAREEPHWGGYACSEVVVPRDWREPRGPQ